MHIQAAAKGEGKHVGIFCGDGAFAKTMADKGFGFVIAGTDLGIASAGAKRELDTVRGVPTTSAPGAGY